MTRKYYEKAAWLLRNVAWLLRNVQDNDTRRQQIDNPRFDEAKFRAARKPPSTYKNRSRANKELK